MLAPEALFDLDGLTHASLFEGADAVWDVLDRIKSYTASLVEELGDCCGRLVGPEGETTVRTVVILDNRVYDSGFELLGGDPTKGEMRVRVGQRETGQATVVHAGAIFMGGGIHLAPGCKIEPGALITGPTVIGPGSEVRQGAYLRGGCLIGKGCVVGHTTEVKNAVMLDGAKAGHFAYLGDSILGRGVNLGAGTKLANLKIIDKPYRLKIGDETHVINRRKFGAILGDGCETGCNSVTNPGTILGRRCLVAPCTSVPAGYHPCRSVIR